jgi:DNA-binding transcriptional ArsR family regulator
MMQSQISNKNRFKAKIFKALSDPARLTIIDFLRDGEKCVCEIIPHIKLIQPVVSRHLKILKDAGLIKGRKDGNRRLYSIADQQIFRVIDGLDPELVASLKERILQQIM